MNYIFDTSSVILLLQKCNLRNQLLEFSKTNKLYAPIRVKKEYLEGGVTSSNVADFEEVFLVINSTLEEVLLPYFNFDDSSGELWAISYALRNPECCCVIDEEFGRNVATLFEIKLTGAIGIIKELKSHNLLSDDDLRKIRVKIRKSRFYLSKELLEELDKICLSQQT